MPTGKYPRSPELMKAVRENLAKGRTPEVQARAAATLKELSKSPQWREKVSRGTEARMHDPEVRARHLAGLSGARKRHGVNFKGGNGQALTPIITALSSVLLPLGYVREYVIKTKGCGIVGVPPGYKADFANPDERIVIEIDGLSHRGRKARERDTRKSAALQALGWTVIRRTNEEIQKAI